jgi:predicted TIM-barrel fold metal-dependent hydrolase
MPDPFKIDAHVHVFTNDMPLIDNPRHAPTYSFTHEELIATLDTNGVDRAVIAAASPWGDYNDYMLAALRAHGRRRLRATAIFRRPMERFELEAMSREGFCGIRLPFIGLPALPDIATFDYRALFRRLADLDWHVHPHVDGEDLLKILPVLEASGVKIVVDHLGRPEPTAGINSAGFKRLLASIDKGRTWVKVSGGYRLGPQAKDYARELLRVAGPDRLVWASDCPFVGHEGKFPYAATVDWLLDAIPDAKARARIFGETARALYFGGE